MSLTKDEYMPVLNQLDAFLPEVVNLLCSPTRTATMELCVASLVPAMKLLRTLLVETDLGESPKSAPPLLVCRPDDCNGNTLALGKRPRRHSYGGSDSRFLSGCFRDHQGTSIAAAMSTGRRRSHQPPGAKSGGAVGDPTEPPPGSPPKSPPRSKTIASSTSFDTTASVSGESQQAKEGNGNGSQDTYDGNEEYLMSNYLGPGSMGPIVHETIEQGLGSGNTTAVSRPTLNLSGLNAASQGQHDFGSCRGFETWSRPSLSETDFGCKSSQRSHHFYVHPEGRLRIIWDLCSLALILVLMLVTPFELSFLWEEEEGPELSAINIGSDLFFAADIVLNCFTAFHSGKGSSSRLITNPRLIVKNYASKMFWIDLIATFPFSRIAAASAGGPDDRQGTEAVGMLRALKVAKVARMLKVLRVLKLGGLMQLLEEQLVSVQSMTVAFQLMKLTMIMLLISHCTACMWFAVGHIGNSHLNEFPTTWLLEEGLVEKPPFDQYVSSFYFAITTGTTVGYGDISATNTLEQIVASLLLVAVVAYSGHFLARVGQVVSSLKQSEAEMVKAKRDAMLFMRKRSVPKDLYRKVLRYIEHIYETESITSLDNRVLDKLSESLQMQLALAVTGNILRKHPLFSDADDAFVTAICRVCGTRRACIGDVLAREEQSADEMFLLVRGEVLVMQGGQQVGILRDEDWFGVRSLFVAGMVHTITIRCETDCELLVLGRSDFRKQVCLFPRVRREYDKIAAQLESGSDTVSLEAERPDRFDRWTHDPMHSLAQAFRLHRTH